MEQRKRVRLSSVFSDQPLSTKKERLLVITANPSLGESEGPAYNSKFEFRLPVSAIHQLELKSFNFTNTLTNMKAGDNEFKYQVGSNVVITFEPGHWVANFGYVDRVTVQANPTLNLNDIRWEILRNSGTAFDGVELSPVTGKLRLYLASSASPPNLTLQGAPTSFGFGDLPVVIDRSGGPVVWEAPFKFNLGLMSPPEIALCSPELHPRFMSTDGKNTHFTASTFAIVPVPCNFGDRVTYEPYRAVKLLYGRPIDTLNYLTIQLRDVRDGSLLTDLTEPWVMTLKVVTMDD